jgi:hypothetical protein
MGSLLRTLILHVLAYILVTLYNVLQVIEGRWCSSKTKSSDDTFSARIQGHSGNDSKIGSWLWQLCFSYFYEIMLPLVATGDPIEVHISDYRSDLHLEMGPAFKRQMNAKSWPDALRLINRWQSDSILFEVVATEEWPEEVSYII